MNVSSSIVGAHVCFYVVANIGFVSATRVLAVSVTKQRSVAVLTQLLVRFSIPGVFELELPDARMSERHGGVKTVFVVNLMSSGLIPLL